MEDTQELTVPDAIGTGPLHLTVDPMWEYLGAVEFGRVGDGWPLDCTLGLEGVDELRLLLATPDGPAVGFEVWDWNDFVLPDDVDELWEGPRFDVPRLGLEQATIGEILIAARAAFPTGCTIDAHFFHMALGERDLDQQLLYWESALDAGDMKAHFGWGCALLSEAGRPREAYLHLRRYTEVAPANAWAWHWRAQACEALGEIAEAIQCYERAIECEELSGMDTDADERLAQMLAQ